MRDALGLMEQVAALGGGKVDGRGVTRALGLAPSEAFTRLSRAIAEHDAPGALALAASLASEGADLRRFVGDAIEFFRGVFLIRYAPKIEEIVDEPADVIEEWRAEARNLESSDVLRTVEVLGEALAALRDGREERLVVELAMLRLARPEVSIDPASLGARIDRLEDRMRRLNEGAAPLPPVAARAALGGPAAGAGARAITRPDRRAGSGGSRLGRRAERGRPGGQGAPARGQEGSRARSGGASGSGGPSTGACRSVIWKLPATAPPPPASLDLAAVETVWPALIERVRKDAGPRRHALLRACRPVAVEGSRLDRRGAGQPAVPPGATRRGPGVRRDPGPDHRLPAGRVGAGDVPGGRRRRHR